MGKVRDKYGGRAPKKCVGLGRRKHRACDAQRSAARHGLLYPQKRPVPNRVGTWWAHFNSYSSKKKIVPTRFLRPDALSQNPSSSPGTISNCDRFHRSMRFLNPEPCGIHVVMKFATAARGTTPVYRVNEIKL